MASDRVQRRVERLLDQAEEAADEFNWQRVCELTQNILAFDPANTDALGFLAAAERALSGSIPQPVSQTQTSAPTSTSTAKPDYPTESELAASELGKSLEVRSSTWEPHFHATVVPELWHM